MGIFNKKYLPKGDVREHEFSYMLVAPTEDGGAVPFFYVPEKDEKGRYKPLNQHNFYESLWKSEKAAIESAAAEREVDPALLYGITEENILLTGEVEKTAPPAPTGSQLPKPARTEVQAPQVSAPLPSYTTAPSQPHPTGPIGSPAPSKLPAPQPNLFYISEENKEEYKAVPPASNTFAQRNLVGTTADEGEVSGVAAIATHLLADNFASYGLNNTNALTDKQLGEIFTGYFAKNGINITPEQASAMVARTRSYNVNTYFPHSVKFDKKKMSQLDRVSPDMLRGKPLMHEVWWEHRNERIGEFGDNGKYNVNSDVVKAVEFYQDPENNMNTMLFEKDEKEYQKWMSDMKDKGIIGKNDNSYDYDYRGYWQKYILNNKKPPALNEGMHFPDEFKKPNHPTFSKESKWARGTWEEYAGTWNGEQYTPGRVAYPRADQDYFYQYTKDNKITPEEAFYNAGLTRVKIQRKDMDKPTDDGVVTGFSGTVEPKDVKFATSKEPSPEQKGTITRLYGNVVHETQKVSNPVLEKIDELNAANARAQAIQSGGASAFNEYSWLNVGTIQGSGGLKSDVKGEEVTNEALIVLNNSPITVMVNCDKTTFRPMYDKIIELKKAREELLAPYSSGEVPKEVLQRVQEIDNEVSTLQEAFVNKQIAWQQQNLHGVTPRVVREEKARLFALSLGLGTPKEEEKGKLKETTAGVSKDTAAEIRQHTYGNFNIGWALKEQMLATVGKEGDNGARIWAAILPATIEQGVTNIVTYESIAKNSLASDVIPSGREQGSKFAQRKSWVVSQFEDDFVSAKVRELGGNGNINQVKAQFDDLFTMYTLLGYAHGKGNGDFDEAFVKKEIALFKDNFLISSNHGVIIDKKTARLAGIETVEELDAMLGFALAEVKEAMLAEQVSMSTLNDMQTKELVSAFDSVIVPVLYGDDVYFAVRDKEINRMLLIDGMKGSQPLSISLKNIADRNIYDQLYYQDQIDKTGYFMTPRSYIEDLPNGDKDIKVGYVSRRYRPQTFTMLHTIASNKFGQETDYAGFLALEKEYHNLLFGVQKGLSGSPMLKQGVTTVDIERELVRNIQSAIQKHLYVGGPAGDAYQTIAPFAEYSSLLEIPGVQEAVTKTIQKFIPAPFYNPALIESGKLNPFYIMLEASPAVGITRKILK